jgi:type I restriction enzyme M protein
MHILKALKSNGKAAVILPHGVLFRGNAEATIRKAIIKKHWIKGIISLPANLFYGTGIAACVLVIDKEGAANRQGIFMIDASRGYIKDGNKNRLRECDIYRIITTFNEQITTDPKYARFVPNDEIEKKNEYNLNITRYIDSTDSEDIQDIYAHIHGGIPAVDIDSLSKYWDVFPSLKVELLSAINEKYYSLNVEHENIRQTIYKNAEFSDYGEKLDEAFATWKAKEYPVLSTLDEDVSARELIVSLAEDILAEFEHLTLIDKYDVYQVLLAYWNEVMNDDVSLIISEADGYANARATDNIEEEITSGKKKGEMKITGWEGRLIPKDIVIDAFFREEKNAVEEAENVVAETESQLSDLIGSADEESSLADVAENGKVKAKDIEAKIAELTQHVETEETVELTNLMVLLPMQKKRLQAYLAGHPLCESVVNDKGNVTKTAIIDRLTIIRTVESVPESLQDDVNQLKAALELCGKVSDYNKVVKDLNKALDEKCRARYETLTDEESLNLLVNRKWFDGIFYGITDLYAAISHRLTNRIVELAERYESTLPELLTDTTEYEAKVKSHLERMGFEW